MDMETENLYSGRQKRKHSDDFVVDLLNNVSLSPHKRLRQDGGLPTIYEECPNVVTSADCNVDVDVSPQPMTDLTREVPEPLSIHATDERAIVLYKPVSPPLFPGGPIAGSPDLPIKVDTRFLTSSGMLDASNLLTASRNYAQFPWLPLGSSSSMSGDPQSSEQRKQSDICSDNRLAMIPWQPNETSLPAAGLNMYSMNEVISSQGTTRNISTDADEMPVEGADEMRVEAAVDSAAMEEDNWQGINDTTQSNSNNPVLNLGSEPWQHYGVPQSPYSSGIWSHIKT